MPNKFVLPSSQRRQNKQKLVVSKNSSTKKKYIFFGILRFISQFNVSILKQWMLKKKEQRNPKGNIRHQKDEKLFHIPFPYGYMPDSERDFLLFSMFFFLFECPISFCHCSGGPILIFFWTI